MLPRKVRGDNFQVHSKIAHAMQKSSDDQEYIYTPYITKKGKRIYRKGGGVFRIPVSRMKKR